MAETIRGITLEIGGSTTGLQAALSDVNKITRDTTSELKAVEKLLKLDPTNTTLLAQKQQLLAQAIANSREKLDRLNAAQAQVNAQFERGDITEGQYRAFQREVVTAEQSLRSFTEQQERLTDAADAAGDEINNLGDDMGDAGDKALSFGDILKANLTGTAIIDGIKAIAGAIKEFAMESIKLASDLQEVQNVVDTTFEESAEAVREWSEEADTAFGLSLLNAEKFSSTLGAMLKSSGIAGETLVEMSTTLAGVAADFASFYNLDVEAAFDKIRQAVGGETEGLKQLGINLSQANLMQTDYAQSLNKSWNEMTAAEQAMTRYNAILQLGSDAIGDFAKTSDSYANQTKILELQVENLKTSLGEKLLPVAQSVVGALNDILDTSESLESLTAASNALENVGKSYEDSVSSITAASEVSQQYVDRLAELESQGFTTAEAQDEYRQIVDQLNALIPNLNLTIDEQTGIIRGNTDAIRGNIDAWKEAALEQALQEKYKDIIEANAAAEAELLDNKARLDIANKKEAAANAQLDKLYLQIAAAMGLTGDEAKKAADAAKKMSNTDFRRYAESAEQSGAKTAELAKQVVELREQIMGLDADEKKYSEAVEENKEAVEAQKDEVDVATQAYQENTEATEGSTTATTDFAETLKTAKEATATLSSELATVNSAFQEQAEKGSLSLDTILKLIDAGYAAALSVDAETGAVTLDKEAYIALEKAKIATQKATLEALKTDIITKIKNENSEVAKATGGYIGYALAKALANDADEASLSSIEAQLAAIKEIEKNLDKTAGAYSNYSGGASRAADKTKTAAQEIAETLKATNKENSDSLAIEKANMELVAETEKRGLTTIEKLSLEKKKAAASVEALTTAYEESRKRLGEDDETTKQYARDLELARIEVAKTDVEIQNALDSDKRTRATQEITDAFKAASKAASDSYETEKANLELNAAALNRNVTETEKLNAEKEKAVANVEALTTAYEESKTRLGENDDLTKQYARDLELARIEVKTIGYEIKNSNADSAQSFRDLADEIDEVEKKYRTDLADALEDYQSKVADINKQMLADEQSVTDEYNALVSERADALSNFVGLFDSVEAKDVSGETLLNNLRGQVDAFEDWQQNISDLSARGIDEGLLKQLKEMGPQAGSEISALNTLTDGQLTEYVNLWKEKNQAAKTEAESQLTDQHTIMLQKLEQIRSDAAIQLEQYRQEWEAKNAEITANTNEELTKIQTKFSDLATSSTTYGSNFVEGFVGGMESKFDRLREAAQEMADIVSQGVTDPLEINSPSKLADEYGQYFVGGFANGIYSSLSKLSDAMNAFSGMVVPQIPAYSMGGGTTTTTYNRFDIAITGSNAEEIWDELKWELHRAGVIQ